MRRSDARRQFLHNVVAILLAGTLLAFLTEPCEDEYEANHPQNDGSCSLTTPSLSWESFDKENVVAPVIVDARIQIEFLFLSPPSEVNPQTCLIWSHPVRDKSPPG
jgi:hypothetical protein